MSFIWFAIQAIVYLSLMFIIADYVIREWPR